MNTLGDAYIHINNIQGQIRFPKGDIPKCQQEEEENQVDSGSRM